MAWKERFTSRRTLLMRLVGGLAFLGIGLPLVYYAIQNFLLAFGESWSRSANDGSWSAHQHRSNLEYLIREITPLLFTLGFLGVATSAAAAITSEHEGDTWTCLTLTDLMGREVVLGKMAGAVKPGLRFLLAMLILATMGVITGSVHVLTLPFMAIEGALFLSFAAAFGIWISMSLKSTWRAQFLTVALLFLIGMLGQTALNLTKSYTPPVWPGLFPVEIAHTIVGPDALERFRQSGFVWGELQFNHFAESNAWLIVLRVIAPLIYGTLAVLLTFFSIRGFDRAAGRPKRSKSNHLITSFLKVLPKIEKPVTS